MNFEEIGCNFADWLKYNGYIDLEEEIEEMQYIIDDLKAIYEVAPRLVNLIKMISDRYNKVHSFVEFSVIDKSILTK